jgi:hypothetical protein
MRLTPKRALLIAALALAAFVGLRAWQWTRPEPALTVSRDSTFLTEPLRPDGMVDYIAAWNREHGTGVTASNNAAPLILAALGEELKCFDDEVRAATPTVSRPFADSCSWEESHLPDEGDASSEESRPIDEIESMLERGVGSNGDVARIRSWLVEQQEALELGAEAAERTRWFEPCRDSLRFPATHSAFDVAWALVSRAQLESREGDWEDGLADLGAALRLVRLEASTASLAEQMFGEALEPRAWRTARSIARTRRGGVTAAEFAKLYDVGDPVPLEVRLREAMRWGRVAMLDDLDRLMREEPDASDLAIERAFDPGDFPPEMTDRATDDLSKRRRKRSELHRRVGLERLHRHHNAWWNRFEGALFGKGTWFERLRALSALDRAARRSMIPLVLPLFVLSPDQVAESIAATTAIVEINILRGAVSAILRTTADVDRTLAELAALAFVTETGRDPASTDDLTPLVFEKPFRDRVTGSALKFRRDEKGEIVAEGPAVELLRKLEEEKAR